ncbi:phosphoribosylformylglycinamidine cyclo-ligase [Vulgatibacter incomptus]|uniref:Phosphoribosylformylglycinamidine cyclo-ligase n=1 Tax=Vulgatibacter incomptus TaxID=1391653 RepID=A0A0K1P8X9_9BACT|nr:phosphoribosylformylglycinamidine cyclo-ligase [Vulgatibacter incomptus]AKU89866.1 Phosphoribosylformylglycinamidine cyclo-ligase [Vulgatibacter incomptus]
MAITYRDSGVDIEEGDRLVERIKPHAKKTMRPEVMAGIGGFASLVSLPKGYREPILVSGTDGVGTKLKVAFLAGRHDTIGQDLVAMCVNDVACTGAEPLFFLDYFGTGKLSSDQAADVVAGIADGCAKAGCALVGGETAELPGFYAPGEYDLAGFCVGVVEKSEVIDGKRVQVGDVVIGLPSSGLHSNGYSLARKVLLEAKGMKLDERPEALGGRTLGEALLEPTTIYVRDLLALRRSGVDVRSMSHITGGGLVGNVPRTLPDGTKAMLDSKAWKIPAIFEMIREGGDVPADDMLQTFNLGIGFTIIVPRSDEGPALQLLRGRGIDAVTIGEIQAGSGEATCEIK